MKPAVSFGLISDCQYTDEDDESYDIPAAIPLRYVCNYRKSPRKLNEAIEFFNTQQLDFVVHLGDFIDRRTEEIHHLTPITDQSVAPFWHVIGNHEYKDQTFPIQKVVDLYGMPSRYYAKELNGYRFIVIDSNEIGVIAHPEGSKEWLEGEEYIATMKAKGLVNAYPWNGGVSDVQFEWIEQQIIDAQQKNQHVIIFSHHPIFPPGPLNMLTDSRFLALIKDYDNVRAFFSGHNHLGNYVIEEGIPYVTVSGIVEGNENAYGIVHLSGSGDGILQGYGRQTSHEWKNIS